MSVSKLYHYSLNCYDELLTRRAQGENYKDGEEEEKLKFLEETNGVGLYIDSMSLFFDPIPRDLPDILEKPHPFWTNGRVICEHVVLLSDIGDAPFSVTEQPDKNLLVLNTDFDAPGFDWIAWHKQKNLLVKNSGDTGYGLTAMRKTVIKYKNKTRKFYIDAQKLHKVMEKIDPNYDGREKYAAFVPHLDLYPKNGKVRVHEHNTITLGTTSLKKW